MYLLQLTLLPLLLLPLLLLPLLLLSLQLQQPHSSWSLRSELKAFHVYATKHARGPAPDYAKLIGCGPTATSYEHGGVSAEGCLARSPAFFFGRG